MREKTCCFTGHRPEKLFMSEDSIKAAMQYEIAAAINDRITTFISGMARGIDLWAAQLVLEAKKGNPRIKLICAIPYEGFEEKWSEAWQQLYQKVIAASDFTRVFYPAFNYGSYQMRNRWMVDHSIRMIAVYHGGRGGTYNTLEYAKTQNIRVCMIPG